jgi:hypothetical protein
MKKILILIIIGLTLSVFNCKDKEEIIRHVDPELKEWGLYQKGTWWVYEEENTKDIDSFWVDSVIEGFFTLEGRENKKWQELFTIVKSNSNSYDDIKLSITGQSPTIYLTTKNNISQEFGPNCIIASIPFIKGERFSTGDVFMWTEMDTFYNELQLGKNIFRNVVRAKDNGNPAFFGQNTCLYTAKNIGIVRKEFPERNQIWNLVRFHIIQ